MTPVTAHSAVRERLIVALDVPNAAQAWALVDSLGTAVCAYKVGWRLFLAEGMAFVQRLREKGYEVFLDLKIDDIGETVRSAVEVLAGKVDLLTVQGSAATASAAVAGRGAAALPRILFVTLLSSRGLGESHESLGVAIGEDDFIVKRARLARDAGCEGVIASGPAIRKIRLALGKDLLIVTPGIRPSGSPPDEHKRSLTPAEAIAMGADRLVVGRPIRSTSDPAAAAAAILSEIEGALAD